MLAALLYGLYEVGILLMRPKKQKDGHDNC